MTKDEKLKQLQERLAQMEDTVFTLQVYQRRLISMLEVAQQDREIFHGLCERAGLLEDGPKEYMQ